MTDETEPGDTNNLISRGLMNIAGLVTDYEAWLRHAGHIFDLNRDIEGGRAGVEAALIATMEFCYRLQLEPELIRPLLQLRNAFENVDKGISDPLFAKRVLQGRSTIPDSQLRMRGMLAGAVRALIDGGVKKPKALAWVAIRARAIDKRITRTNVRNWYDEAMSASHEAWNCVAYRQACFEMQRTGIYGPTAAEKLVAEAIRLSREI